MKNQPLDTLNEQGDGHKEEGLIKIAETAELKPSNLEQKREEFLEKIEKFREKEKFYNEEKIRLNKRLEALREELGLVEQKEKTAEIETSINGETLPEEKEGGVIPVADTQKEVSEIIKTETGQEITVLKEPLQINVEEIINENVSAEEKDEIQEQFPDENVEKVIEKEVVKQINDKTITPVEKREKDNLLDRSARKVKLGLLAIFVSTSVFESTAPFFKTADKNKVFSYNNMKVDNLKDWEKVKLYEDEINKLENISIITKAHENSDDKYIIIDKQNGKLHRYQGDNLIKSYDVGLGLDSIGDDQTTLKSVYKKNLKELGRDEEGDMLYDTQEVSIEEATYVKDGERYLKDGYAAWTDWGEGNMQTGAGTYTISNKGPFHKNKGIFLKNERGIQVATSVHFNSHVSPKMPSHHFTNGCVGCDQPTIDELYSVMSTGENVYILPANPHNKYQIIDGELRFLSNQQNVNRTIRPYKPEPIILKAEDVNDIGKELLIRISENKEKLMSLYPTVSNDVYNELAKIAYGIFGQESTFGTFGKGRGQLGRLGDIAKTITKVGRSPSVGLCQVSIENISPKIKEAFNINKTIDLLDVKTNVAAAMSVLLDNYLYAVYNGKADQYQKIAILRYNAPKATAKIIKGQLTFEQLDPIPRGYMKKVLNNSKLARVYSANPSENYYASNWNYNSPNN